MPSRNLKWTSRFAAKYRTLQDDAFGGIKSGNDKPMKRFLGVGETLKLLQSRFEIVEKDPGLDTKSYQKLSHHAPLERVIYGSRILKEPKDYRVLWQHSGTDATIELVDLIWPCL